MREEEEEAKISSTKNLPKTLDPEAQEFCPSHQNPSPNSSQIPPPFHPPPYPHTLFPAAALPRAPLLPPPSPVPTRAVLLISVFPDTTEAGLRRDMGPYGELRRVDMEGLPEGIVTVHFFDVRQAEAAMGKIRLRGVGREAAERGHIAAGALWAQYGAPAADELGTLEILGLGDVGVRPSQLKETFEAFGPIKEVSEPKIKQTGWFVEFFDVRDAATALSELKGKEIHGKQVKIRFGQPSAGLATTAIVPHLNVASFVTRIMAGRPSFVDPFQVCLWKSRQRARPEDFSLIIDENVIKESDLKDARTTLMIKNIPNKYSRKLLISMLDYHCIQCNERISGEDRPASCYDFLYLRIDFNNKCNVGYGFVNLTSPQAAWRLYKAFHRHRWDVLNSHKICEVTYARVQGLEALKRHFENSKFACMEDEYLPVVFSPPRDGKHLTDPVPIIGELKHDLSIINGGANGKTEVLDPQEKPDDALEIN